MGLDMVELVMAVEEEFSISFKDGELNGINTVGEFYDIILGKIDASDEKDVVSSIIFYKLRKGIMEISEIERKNIRPSTFLRDIFKRESIKEKWRDFEKITGYTLPKLVLSERVLLIVIMTNLITITSIIIFLVTGSFMNAGILFIIVIILNLIINNIFRYNIPKKIEKISDLVAGLFVVEYKSARKEGERISKLSVWTILVGIIVEQFGVEATLVTKNADFFEDLGAG